LLEAVNIIKTYSSAGKSFEVLKGVSFKAQQGEFAAIVGPSGAGKSTLLHILGGLDNPTGGRVVLQGDDLYGLGEARLAHIRNVKIGFVFQFYHLLPELTVLENVLLPGIIRDGNSTDVRDAALEMISQAGLIERAGHFPSQLSGGEMQRVAVVRSLINKPGLLLCDEPTGNLDSNSAEGIISMIRDIRQSHRATVILVTHNLELAKKADNVYNLRDGLLN
jgi:ABC-type lipoprotein export system ATPase subunit